MNGLERGAAFARRGVVISVALLAAAWTPSMGLTQQPDPSAEQAQPVGARWSIDSASKLAQVIESSRREGLDPAWYDIAGLRRAAENGAGPALDQAADAAAMRLARDYYFGRVSERSDMGWMIRRPDYEPRLLAERLTAAIASGDIKKFYASLLPTDERYRALRDALADAGDPVQRDRIRANMERWRWMPRVLGDDYLYVNVPSYQLQVMDGGRSIASYDVVVGAPDTKTPMLASPTSSLVVNPWWNVPQSIVKSSNMRPGKGNYQFQRVNGGYRVRQAPGPKNALGKIKFNLANDQAIYLHDTPSKWAFNKDERALSHGCIRVKDIDQLASQLMGEDGKDTAQFDDALVRSSTATVRLPRTWQVYIVYFTMDGDDSGNLTAYSDPYGYDALLLARMDGRPSRTLGGGGVMVAAR